MSLMIDWMLWVSLNLHLPALDLLPMFCSDQTQKEVGRSQHMKKGRVIVMEGHYTSTYQKHF